MFAVPPYSMELLARMKFGVTQTFCSFWPIVTLFRKELLRSGETVPCFSRLIAMEITIGARLWGMGSHVRRLNKNVARWGECVHQIAETVFGTLCAKLRSTC